MIPRPRRCRATTLILLGAAAGAGPLLTASELVERDFIFTVGEVPSAFSYTATSANGSRTGNDAFSQNIGVTVPAFFVDTDQHERLRRDQQMGGLQWSGTLFRPTTPF